MNRVEAEALAEAAIERWISVCHLRTAEVPGYSLYREEADAVGLLCETTTTLLRDEIVRGIIGGDGALDETFNPTWSGYWRTVEDEVYRRQMTLLAAADDLAQIESEHVRLIEMNQRIAAERSVPDQHCDRHGLVPTYVGAPGCPACVDEVDHGQRDDVEPDSDRTLGLQP